MPNKRRSRLKTALRLHTIGDVLATGAAIVRFSFLQRLLPFVLVTVLWSCAPTGHLQPDADGTATTRSPDPVVAAMYQASTPGDFDQHCERSLEALDRELLRLAAQQDAGIAYLRQVDQFLLDLGNSYNISQLYAQVHPEPALRESASQCQQSLGNRFTEFTLSAEIFAQLENIESGNAFDDTRRFHEQLLRDYRRAGVNQSAEVREQIRSLNDQINALGQAFSKNIREDVRRVEVSKRSELAGMPDDYIDSLARENDNWVISTDYPELFPLLRYAHNDALRKRIYIEFLNRGYPANGETLLQIIQLREQLAQLLGYRHFADYATETAMIGSASQAGEFIERITSLAAERAARDYQQLVDELRRDQPAATDVGNWQKAYLRERAKQRIYAYEPQQVRQYFSYDKVKRGMFELARALFDVEIVDWDQPTWHDTVSAHELRDRSGKTLGFFYLDMHPRPGKYKHAAHFPVRPGVAGQQLPVSALICNFPGSEGPGLMEHNQVETFLHEFGHLMHSLLAGQQRWSTLSGISTERDFVEAPSQLLEEWVWNYETLARFASNDAGEVLPYELFEKMRAARNFNRGARTLHQMFYAALSLHYYSAPASELDLQAAMIELQSQYSPFAYIEGTHFYANFGHLFGYNARYYTYMWSEVIAADLFSEFRANGLLDATTARRYREAVLAPGGSRDALQLIEAFLGRPFNYDAFVKQLDE